MPEAQQRRQAWQELDPARLVFLDESEAPTQMTRKLWSGSAWRTGAGRDAPGSLPHAHHVAGADRQRLTDADDHRIRHRRRGVPGLSGTGVVSGAATRITGGCGQSLGPQSGRRAPLDRSSGARLLYPHILPQEKCQLNILASFRDEF